METKRHRLKVLERLCWAGSPGSPCWVWPCQFVFSSCEDGGDFWILNLWVCREFDDCLWFLLALGLDKAQYLVRNAIAKCIHLEKVWSGSFALRGSTAILHRDPLVLSCCSAHCLCCSQTSTCWFQTAFHDLPHHFIHTYGFQFVVS